MGRTRRVARMALGGAVCGGFLGSPLGAALGLILGLLWGNVSWGLDGAVLGALILGGAGAGAGALLGWTADDSSLSRAEPDRPLLPRGEFFTAAGKSAPPGSPPAVR